MKTISTIPLPRAVCAKSQDVYELARERFGAAARVCVTVDAGNRRVIGRVAAHWSGPWWDVVVD